MPWTFERVAGPFAFSEGPVWDGEAILFTDIPNHRIMRYDRSSGECAAYRTATEGANGLALSPDEDVLYVAESPPSPQGRRELRAYPVLADGSLGTPRVLHDSGVNRGIDGMRVDAAGAIVAACGWNRGGPGPRIAVFSPEGTVLAEHPVPDSPTNCAFGDEDGRALYVTDYTGSLLRADTDRWALRLLRSGPAFHANPATGLAGVCYTFCVSRPGIGVGGVPR